jgi:hypothetical protein
MARIPPPSIFKIAWADYPSFIATFTPLVAWIMFVCTSLVRDVHTGLAVASLSQAVVLFYLAVTLTIGGVVLLTWRGLAIRRLFVDGVETKGKLQKVEFKRDRGRVEVTFNYKGKAYLLQSSLHRSKQTLALKKAPHVILLIDPQNPARGLIRDIYR